MPSTPSRQFRGLLITLSGVDCAGKSTQLERLADRLAANKHPSRVLWYRPGYSSNLDALRRVLRSFKNDALPPPGPSARRDAVFSKPQVRAVWLCVALVDTVLELGVRLRTILYSGQVVLCDRYILDALLDLQLRFPELPIEYIRPLLQAVCPRPDVSILLNLNWLDVQKRARIKNEPFPDDDVIREKRYLAYADLARQGDLTAIDASGSIDEVHERIWEQVSQKLELSDNAENSRTTLKTLAARLRRRTP